MLFRSICSFELLLKVLFKGSYLLVSSCSIFKVLCRPLGTAYLLYHAQFRLSSTFFRFFQSLFQSASIVPDGFFMLPYLVQFVNRFLQFLVHSFSAPLVVSVFIPNPGSSTCQKCQSQQHQPPLSGIKSHPEDQSSYPKETDPQKQDQYDPYSQRRLRGRSCLRGALRQDIQRLLQQIIHTSHLRSLITII